MSSSSNSGTLRPEWEAGEGLGLIDNAPDNDARVSRRILGDVAGDSLEILESASRPDYSVSHLLRRASTSSCVIVPFTRASSRPRRTLSRTYRWYWMSSTEQSSGSLLSSCSTSCFAVLIVPSIKDNRGGPILRGAKAWSRSLPAQIKAIERNLDGLCLAEGAWDFGCGPSQC